jgi:hypothetical protein
VIQLNTKGGFMNRLQMAIAAMTVITQVLQAAEDKQITKSDLRTIWSAASMMFQLDQLLLKVGTEGKDFAPILEVVGNAFIKLSENPTNTAQISLADMGDVVIKAVEAAFDDEVILDL